MRRVIVESPFAGDVERNLRYLRACMRDCIQRGEAPFASHGLYTQPGVLRDDVHEERDRGIAAGFAWREQAEATVIYMDLGMSAGMERGLQHARRQRHAIEYRTLGGEWGAGSAASQIAAIEGCGCECEPHTCESEDELKIGELRTRVKQLLEERNDYRHIIDVMSERIREAIAQPGTKTLGWRCGWCGTVVGTVADGDCGVEAGKQHSLTCAANPAVQARDAAVAEVERLRAEIASPSRQPAAHYQCNACEERMRTWKDFPEYQHEGCGGLVELAAVIALRDQRNEALYRADGLQSEVDRLTLLINMPRTDDFFEAVRIEAAHQIERWGVDHDAGKRPEDWITLYTYLLGKAAKAHFEGNRDKLLHHVITVAAVALNWHRNATGENTRMRPGVGQEAPSP